MYFRGLRSDVETLFANRFIRLVLKIMLLPLFFLTKLWPFSRKRLLIDHLEIVVGSKCSLRCKKCANLMQYYEHPANFPVSQVKEDCRKLLELDVKIRCIHLIGGEPFLYKELQELILLLQHSRKVGSIRIITNGTIIPDNTMLKYLKFSKVHILISNYVHVGAKTNELFQFLQNAGIEVRLSTVPWYNYHHNFSGFERCPEELQAVYKSCGLACRKMLNGEIHLCPTSAHGMYLGLIPRDADSFVSIRHNGSKEEKNKILRDLKLLLNHQVPNACNYCSGGSGEIIPVAEQLPPGTYLNSEGHICHRNSDGKI